MTLQLRDYTRHRCFISYHADDEEEVRAFVDKFDHDHDVFIARGIGASMPTDVIDSRDPDYIKRRIRETCIRDTSVTIVLLGRCTWARRFVDWEIAASLRNTTTSKRNGLLAITLPSAVNDKRLPDRLADNHDGQDGYARWWKYPTSTQSLSNMIEEAYEARTTKAHLADNTRPLFDRNRSC